MPGPDKEVLMQATELAERGRYEQALGLLQEYLKGHPNDPEALNDAGTILYCLHRGQEAIECLQKARKYSQGEMLVQVLFNLCEAYLAERQPELAVSLLDEMASHEILNVDTINRIANCFVEKGAFGSAIEMLVYSLRLAPNQDILHPMIEIIRSKRTPLFLYAEHDRRLEELKAYLQMRYPIHLCIGGSLPAVPDSMHSRNISIFAGISRALRDRRGCCGPSIVFLDYEDLNHSSIEEIDWTGIQAVFVPSQAAAESIRHRCGTLPGAVRIETIGPSVDAEAIGFTERKKGKRLAAIGPWTAHHNPMFLLQCMQKLHYLDSDMRLYLAGEFEDETVRDYVETMIETMGLENAVFLDGTPRSWARWLKDKHYILSTAVDGRAMRGVLQGMASGLCPVVHRFPGVSEFVEEEFVFVLAEDFCRQILEGAYEPRRYREWVVSQCSPVQSYLPLVRVLSEMEHQISLLSGHVYRESPLSVESSIREATAARPVGIPSPTPGVRQFEELAVGSSSPSQTESIEDLARKALEAAQRLSVISETPKPSEAETSFSVSGRSLSSVPF